ncbi:restriction endonuclease [Pseudomonas lopnurensis]|uniref:restriction endonuclease n=1 Tax=Pseudomonas lopnurensis TaxID=1477517 RepID=UPI00187A76B3|nr:restriction endonuclease [Pseudomonas lopnurensis]MBE7376492.1 restriction endonuclease [Pseudomonas lopnurensis]
MPALNFKEIAPAHKGTERDQFELFARDFLEAEGFSVVVGPDRGQDAGRDLIVSEIRFGPGGQSEYRWLVSCKHKAGSGESVGHNEDINLRDRLGTHRCNGFIAFYSTVASSTLATHLKALLPEYGLLVFDNELIEAKLLDSPKGRALAARYMPVSFQRWVLASQYAEAPATASAVKDRFFLREPHSSLETALSEAAARDAMVFVVVYDELHSTKSDLTYRLGYFMGYELTKRLVDEHFVAVLGSSSLPSLQALIPDDDPLEDCRLIIMDATRREIYSDTVYANKKEALKIVRSAIQDGSKLKSSLSN